MKILTRNEDIKHKFESNIVNTIIIDEIPFDIMSQRELNKFYIRDGYVYPYGEYGQILTMRYSGCCEEYIYLTCIAYYNNSQSGSNRLMQFNLDTIEIQ